MRILFYVEPLVERENPTWKTGWVTNFVRKFYSTMLYDGALPLDFACIVPTALEVTARNVLPECLVTAIDQTELIPHFGDCALSVATGWYEGSLGGGAVQEMTKLIKDKLDDFQPDICITFSPAPFLQRAFPTSKVLHFELGFISRLPFPETVYFDPLGMFESGVLTRFSQEIKSYTPTDAELNFLEQIRMDFCSTRDLSLNPLHEYVQKQLEKFESAILLSLQFSNFYAYDAHAQFKDQYDLLIHTLHSTPEHIAVIVCEHPEHQVLRPETIQHLCQRYPNFVWHPIFRVVYGASHYLMPYVQGVVTVSSSVGMQALLWKRKLAVLGHSHLDIACDTHSVGELCNLISNKNWPSCKDSLLTWLLTRFHLPFDLVCTSGVFTQFLLDISTKDFSSISKAAVSNGISLRELAEYYHQTFVNGSVTAYGNNAGYDSNNFFSALYIATENSPYDEKSCLRKFISWQSVSEALIDFSIRNTDGPPISIRFDPTTQSGNLILSELWISDNKGQKIWCWDGSVKALGSMQKIRTIPLTEQSRLLLQCESSDPQIELAIDPMLLAEASYPIVFHGKLVKADEDAVSRSLVELDSQLEKLNQAATERDNQIADLNQAAAERDNQIADLNQAATERDNQIADLNQAAAERDNQIADLNQAAAERDNQIADLNQAAAERDNQIADLNQAAAERDNQIADLNQAAAERDNQIADLNQAAAERDNQIADLIKVKNNIINSNSWKITKPLRLIKNILKTKISK